MKYWVTTHWAPQEDDELSVPQGVWVPEDRQKAGEELRTGDNVLIYQAAGGPTEIRDGENGQDELVGRHRGRGGIVAICQTLDRLKPNGAETPTRYVGRKPIWWRWHADTALISKNGFVTVDELKRVLNFKPEYTMRGFGDYNSGLKEISEKQYIELVRIFRRRTKKTFRPDILARHRHKQAFEGREGGESDDHKFLKEYVASNPAAILGERGLRILEVEYSFDSGDRADIVLEDHAGRIIGLEIELAVDPKDIVGILQAIKYRHMLAFVHQRQFQETRSFLVAYSITSDIKKICQVYSVECFTVPRDDVRDWKSKSA